LAKEKKPPLPKGRGTTEGGGEMRPLPKGERATKWRGDLIWKPNNEVNRNFEGVCQYIDIVVKESLRQSKTATSHESPSQLR